MRDLLLVNPPLIHSIIEHAGEDLEIVNLVIEDNLISSMNVGIVSIASYLVSKGFDIKIIDLYKESNLQRLKKELTINKYRFVGVSCVTGYSYLPSLECFNLVKKLSSESITVGGGAHLGPLGITAMQECNTLDIIAKYEGEIVLEMLLNGITPEKIDGIVYRSLDGQIVDYNTLSPLIDLNIMPPLDFRLYPNYLDFLPFIEESRGCFAQCSFCVNCFLNQGRIRIKKPERFLEDLDLAVSLYGREKHYVIEALSFGVNKNNTIELLKGMKKFNIEWGVEFRVDSPWSQYIDLMYETGCRMSDVGLESASADMLRLMHKTERPREYIQSASNLFRKIASFPDMNTSYNVLFFLGETPHTMKETVDFIFSHQHSRQVISVFPVFLYPGVPLWQEINFYEQEHGTRVIREGYWDKIHTYPADLSSAISFKESLYFSKLLQRMFLYGEASKKKELIDKDGDTDWDRLSGGAECLTRSSK